VSFMRGAYPSSRIDRHLEVPLPMPTGTRASRTASDLADLDLAGRLLFEPP